MTTAKKAHSTAKAPAHKAKAADKPKADDEHIVQQKPDMSEALAGQGSTMEAIGQGSITEEAPAVHAQEAAAETEGRVVQQGDDVILHTISPIAGNTESRGKVLSVNPDSTIAVRVPLPDGRTQDVTSVHNRQQQGGEPWFELV